MASKQMPDDVSAKEEGTFFMISYKIVEGHEETAELLDLGEDGIQIKQKEMVVEFGREGARMLRNALNRILKEGEADE